MYRVTIWEENSGRHGDALYRLQWTTSITRRSYSNKRRDASLDDANYEALSHVRGDKAAEDDTDDFLKRLER